MESKPVKEIPKNNEESETEKGQLLGKYNQYVANSRISTDTGKDNDKEDNLVNL